MAMDGGKSAAEAIVAQLRNLQDAEVMCEGLLQNIRRSKEGLQQALTALTAAAPMAESASNTAVPANMTEHSLFSPKATATQSQALGRSMAMSHSKRVKPRVMTVVSPLTRQAQDAWSTRPSASSTLAAVTGASSLRTTSMGSTSGVGRPQSVSSAFEVDRGDSRSVQGVSSPQRTNRELTMDMLAQDYKQHVQSNGGPLRVNDFSEPVGRKSLQQRPPVPLPLSPGTDESGQASAVSALSPVLRQSSEAMTTAGLHLARMDESMRMVMDAAAQAGYNRSPFSKSVRQRVSFAGGSSTLGSASSKPEAFSSDPHSIAVTRQASIDEALSRLRQLASNNTVQDSTSNSSRVQSNICIPFSDGALDRLSGNISSVHSESTTHAEAAFSDLVEALSKI